MFKYLITPFALLAPQLLAVAPPEPAPELVEVLPAGPMTIAITIQQGQLELHKNVPYIAKEGDRITDIYSQYGIGEEHGILFKREVHRGETLLGYLSGDGKNSLIMPDKYRGLPLDIEAAEALSSYSLRSADDNSFETPSPPQSVSRKVKPNGMARHQGTVTSLHTVFLSFEKPLQEDARYKLDISALNLDTDSAYFTYAPRFQRSDAVHVNQAGFTPNDTVKRAFVSLWTGKNVWTGKNGGLSYGESVSFHVVDRIRGVRAYSGTADIHWPANRPELMNRDANLIGADVYRLDFSELDIPGSYHIYVEGIGCSYPFEIRPDAWRRVAQTSFRGIFHQRSGVEFEPPYTDYWRPRAHNPQHGDKVYQSKATLLDTSMGIEGAKAPNSFEALIEGATDELLPNAWGGVMDGGDWDRRAQHLIIPRLFLELYSLSPEYFETFEYNIPESGNDLPDIIDEALWIIDFHHRLQREDGAVSGGVESAEHPASGDLSWNEIMPTYAYWPDYWSTHEFVAAASLASRVLADRAPALSQKYKEAALKGMIWAESEYAKEVASGRAKERVQDVRDIRNLAALELYRITGDEKWHSVFLEESLLGDERDPFAVVDQRDAIFSYLSLPHGMGKAEWKKLAREIIISDGNNAVEYARNNAFSLVAPNRGAPIFIGFFSGPIHGQFLARAHALTGEQKYLDTLFAGTQFSLGANPDNVVYMSGIGAKRLNWTLYEDSLKTGRNVPEGIVPYGPFDHGASYITPGSVWVRGQKGFGVSDDQSKLYPDFWDWPPAESHLDMWNHFMQTEPTPWQSMAPSTYSWGYMAAQSGY